MMCMWGDVLCTDGSTVKAADYAGGSKTARGVVFYVDTTGQHGWAVKLTPKRHRVQVGIFLYGHFDFAQFDNARCGYGRHGRVWEYEENTCCGQCFFVSGCLVSGFCEWVVFAGSRPLHKLYTAANTVNNTLTTLQNAGVSINSFYRLFLLE